MSLPRHTLSLAAAALALALGAGAAQAATAYASASVNVRSGAGTSFSVVGVLRPGERVEVDRCRGNWCLVQRSGPDGWVNANYLSAGNTRYDDRRYYDDGYYDDGGYYDDYVYDDIYIRPRSRAFYRPFYRSQFCFGSRNASFCLRD